MFDPALSSKTLILAGGGHSHALLLRLWTMRPKLRPDQAITLVSSHGSTLYSGMVPSLIAGLVTRQQATINLRWLAQQAGVAFIQANVRGIDRQGSLQLLDRPELRFDFSLNLGGQTRRQEYRNAIAIKPLEPALRAISAQDALSDKPNSDPFHCVGAGWPPSRSSSPCASAGPDAPSPPYRRQTATSLHGAPANSSSNPAQRHSCPR